MTAAMSAKPRASCRRRTAARSKPLADIVLPTLPSIPQPPPVETIPLPVPPPVATPGPSSTPTVPTSQPLLPTPPILPTPTPAIPASPTPAIPTTTTPTYASQQPDTPEPSVGTPHPHEKLPSSSPSGAGGDVSPSPSPTELPTLGPTSSLPESKPASPPTASSSPTPSPTPKPNIIFNIQIVDDNAKNTTTATAAPDAAKRDGETPTTTSSTARTRKTNVIGGRTRDNPVNALAMSKNAAAFHDAVRYVACTVAGISVALLLFFHYVSLDPGVDWSKGSAGLLWAPNSWEFVVYLGYLQQMGSLSQLDLPRTPYFLWDFTDAFSWSFFLLPTSSAGGMARRRLEAVVLTGVVAFGDRIGVDEGSLLLFSSLAFVLVFGALFLVYVAIVLLAKRKAEDKFDAVDNYASVEANYGSVYGLRFVSLRFLGLCVLIWLFALYPLSLFSTFEIAMQVDSHVVSTGSLVLSIAVLGLVCFGVLLQCARALYRKGADELADVKNLAVWGSLYAAYTYRRRLFFVVVALVQLSSGVLIGSMTVAGSATALILALLGMQVVYIVAVFFQAGFVSLSVGVFTFALGVVKIANYAIAFAFLDATDASGAVRSRSATAFVVLNSVVLLAWFARHAIMLMFALRALSQRDAKATVNPRVLRGSDWLSQHPTRLVFHEEDDDALLPEMVEFQTPLERDSRAAGGSHGDSLFGAASEPRVSEARVSARGSSVFIAMSSTC
ncbi:hypothetical protein PybrP1_011492, partial [[Pythium] brassicae (nom. inval.)]